MFGTSPVSLFLCVSVRCCAKQKYSELIHRKKELNKLCAVILKHCENFQSFSSVTNMRDYSNGKVNTVKNGRIQEQNVDHADSQMCNGR